MNTLLNLNRKYKDTNLSCVVLGCGTSVNEFSPNPKIFTIGINDIGIRLNPDMLFIVDSKKKFEADAVNKKLNPVNRISSIENTKSKYYVIHDTSWNFPDEKKYTIKLGRNEFNVSLKLNDTLDFGHDSPFMATILAYKMGFTKIGLLGVDYTPHHFYSDDGEHQLVKVKYLDKLNKKYEQLNFVLSNNNITFYNLSEKSKIETVPKMSYSSFLKL